jgi:hypothetical protein
MTNKFHWAPRVARQKVRRLYESDARGLLDEVGHAIYTRCCDMIEVFGAQNGRVACRECGAIILRGNWDKARVLTCEQCGWQVTWGEYWDSYTGGRLLPGAAKEVFFEFVERWPEAKSPAAKMLAIDWLIHQFHEHGGIAGRPVGENVIQGTGRQVSELIESLAYGSDSTASAQAQAAWAERLNDPIRLFRRSHAWARIEAIARELGIEQFSKMSEDDVVREIRRRAPHLFEPSASSSEPGTA